MTDHTEMQIPDDVMEAARAVWLEADDKVLRTDAYVVIARAILAERERCHEKYDALAEKYGHMEF